MTPEQATEFLKKMGWLKPSRVVQGEEREKLLTMLRLMPSESSNNQRFWSESWQVGNKTYVHTTGEGIDELEEIIEDDI